MIELIWSDKLAYAVGLIATDGHLSIDGRHLSLTSKDIEQLNNFKKCLQLEVKISYKNSGYSGLCPHVQFSNVKLYRWLLGIGVCQQKTKNIGKLDIPDKFFFDFLRGEYDGDGYSYAYYDPRWRSSYMIYTTFVAKNKKHLIWLEKTIYRLTGLHGQIGFSSRVFQLRYAKRASLELYKRMFYGKNVICLSRKKDKFKKFIAVAEMEELEDSRP